MCDQGIKILRQELSHLCPVDIRPVGQVPLLADVPQDRGLPELELLDMTARVLHLYQ